MILFEITANSISVKQVFLPFIMGIGAKMIGGIAQETRTL